MLILSIRTDKPEAELGLFNNNKPLNYIKWPAHRELSSTIHLKLKDLLSSQNLALKDLEGLVVFKGPGSFTGLRIGLSVANSLSYAIGIPIVGHSDSDWIGKGVAGLLDNKNEEIVLPEYGALPHITKQRK
jgi:tRNA threonylcarbamoyladenosine biosynthesis protein TsaB